MGNGTPTQAEVNAYGLSIEMVAQQVMFASGQMMDSSIKLDSPEFKRRIAEFLFDVTVVLSIKLDIPIDTLHEACGSMLHDYLAHQEQLKELSNVH